MKIIFIGAGKLATNLSTVLQNAGFEITQIYSRTEASAKMLAKKLHSSYTTKIHEILSNADLYIISVNDDAFDETLQKLPFKPTLLVHTSGSIEAKHLKKYATNYGVIYPLQTFTKKKITDFRKIPICIEASNKSTEKKLIRISEKISEKIYLYNSAQRAKIHLAAVYACNFSNHMYAIAEEILKKESIPFEILAPLINETLANALLSSPAIAQTGPAKRNDSKIIEKHKEMVRDNPLFEKIYSFVSESIYKSKLKR